MISESALDRLRGLLTEPETDAGPAAGATRYEILSVLGRGGMGIVYLARDTALDREVALKVLEISPETSAHADPAPTIAARLAQEAHILGRLEHPGIVPVHDFGRLPDGRLFYAMKRVRGERLDRWMTMTGVDLHARLAVFLRICEAVSFAHAHGVIHRDLKPENIMIGEFGEVLVLDWGVAQLLDRPPEPHGTIVGTPEFMAPEQARGEVAEIDHRADVYALGAMLKTLTDGSGALRAITTKACAEQPRDRYQSAHDLAADVSRFVAGLAVHAHGEPLLDRLARLVRRYRVPLLLILTYLIARMLLFWIFRV